MRRWHTLAHELELPQVRVFLRVGIGIGIAIGIEIAIDEQPDSDHDTGSDPGISRYQLYSRSRNYLGKRRQRY